LRSSRAYDFYDLLFNYFLDFFHTQLQLYKLLSTMNSSPLSMGQFGGLGGWVFGGGGGEDNNLGGGEDNNLGGGGGGADNDLGGHDNVGDDIELSGQ
jgi:hypothetical protein